MIEVMTSGENEQGAPGTLGAYPTALPDNLAFRLPPANELVKCCRRWRARRLSIYGRILEGDLSDDKPLQLLVVFSSEAQVTRHTFVRMESQLASLLGRTVELIEQSEIDLSVNPILRQRVMRSAMTIFAGY